MARENYGFQEEAKGNQAATGSAFPVFLLNVFAKNEKANLTKVECATLKKILGAITAAYQQRRESK